MSGYAIYQTFVIGLVLLFYGIPVTNIVKLSPYYSFALGTFFGLLSLLGILWKKKHPIQTLEISIALRPARLKVYNEIDGFLEFCSVYWTKYCQRMVNGTDDLMCGFGKRV